MNILQINNFIKFDNNLNELFIKHQNDPGDSLIFIQSNFFVHRNINKILETQFPNNYSVLLLSHQKNFKTNKTLFYKVDKINYIGDIFGFIIKKNIIPQIINSNLVDSFNKLVMYAYYNSPIFDLNKNNTLEFYNYTNQNNIWNDAVKYFKEFILSKKISVRHLLKSLPKYINYKIIIQIFDFMLNVNPLFVNELITLSMQDIDDPKIFLEKYSQNKTFNKLEFVDKSIINTFFDTYIYEELPMCLIIPSFNNAKYYQQNLNSVFNQKYKNWRIIYVEDNSLDNTYDLVKKYITENNMWNKVTLIKQVDHNAQTCGRFIAYNNCDDDEIACNLDGDDWLYDREDLHQHLALKYVESGYKKGWKSTYGCFYKSSGPQWLETKTLYPPEIIEKKDYRNYKFLCKHLRTGYAGLYKLIKINDILGPEGKFLHMCSDVTTQFPVLEMAGKDHGNLLQPTYVYNQDNSVQYNNSWYNLLKVDNDYNKNYHDFVWDRLKNTKPYETLETIHNDKYYSFNKFKETLEVVITNQNQYDYIKSKLEHEIDKDIKYTIKIFDNKYIPDTSKIVLYIDTFPENIKVNFQLDKYLKWLFTFEYFLIDDRINISDATPITSLDDDYTIYIGKFNTFINNISASGFYTRQKFSDLLNNKFQNDLSITIKPSKNVSYIVALYNIPINWVMECISSIKDQTSQEHHIIICDDNTPNLNYQRLIFPFLHKIKNEYFGNKMKIIQSRKNMGLAGNNRTMIGYTESSVIACLDPDDAITPETTFETNKIHKENNADFIYSNFYYCDEQLQIKNKGFSRALPENKLVIYENCVSHLRTYKKVSYHKTLGYDASFRSAEDKDIILKFEESGAKFHYLPKELYKYRFNPNSLSKEGADAFNNQKTLQYCKTAIWDSYIRRYYANNKKSPVDFKSLLPRYGMKDIPETNYEKHFNSYFDKIYVINLNDKDDNLNLMKIKLSKINAKNVTIMRFPYAKNIETLQNVFETVTKSDLLTEFEKRENKKVISHIGEIGCIESHLYCLKDALKNNYKRILILEDDVFFEKHFLIKFKEYTDQIPNDWKMLLLGSSQWSWWGNAPYINKNIYNPTRASMGTFAIGISLDFIPDAINSLSLYDGPSDLGGYLKAIIKLKPNENHHSINFLMQKRYPIDKCFVMFPNLIIADTRDSNIRSKTTQNDYEKRCKEMNWKCNTKDLLINNKELSDNIIYTIVNVNDYDNIYDNTQKNELIELECSNNLPFELHNALLKSKNIKINNISQEFTYFVTRIKKLNF